MNEKTNIFTIRLTHEEREYLDKIAKDNNATASEVVRSCIRAQLNGEEFRIGINRLAK